MITGINIPENKEKIAIVAVGYNRKKSLSRLLSSLEIAYYQHEDIPLVISIDASGDEEVYALAREYNWTHGEKYVNIQQERLGLKNHIYQCGDLTKYFKAIILLEDDLYVSPYFYDYVEKTVEKYGSDDLIAEISLYKNEANGYVGLPFHELVDGNDVFLMQDVSTWGECWTEKMWNDFVSWRDSHSEEDILNVNMPNPIKEWDRAWSKYYNAYVVDTYKYCLYPVSPVTTNFSDAGEHGGDNNDLVQVHMLWGNKVYVLPDSSRLTKYDIYFNNEAIYEWLGIDRSDLTLDLYGHFGENKCKTRYLLSTRLLPYKVKTYFGSCVRPIELNVKLGINGTSIRLYDTTQKEKISLKGHYAMPLLNYFANTYNHRLLVDLCIRYYWRQLKKKFKK